MKMANVLLFHCPNCDTIEPLKFHRLKNQLDANHLILAGSTAKIVCARCKHEEHISFNQDKVPDWINDDSRVYNPPTK